jgi:hypothetical protein
MAVRARGRKDEAAATPGVKTSRQSGHSVIRHTCRRLTLSEVAAPQSEALQPDPTNSYDGLHASANRCGYCFWVRVLMTPRTLTVIYTCRAASRRTPAHPRNAHRRQGTPHSGLGRRDDAVNPGNRKLLGEFEPGKPDNSGNNNDSCYFQYAHWVSPFLK